MSREVIASLENVKKDFLGQPVLHGIDLAVERGETMIITGQSGSGKSTCLRTFADLEHPSSGKVSLFGKSLDDLSAKEKARIIADKVSYAQQDPNLDTGLSVFLNLTLTTRSIRHDLSRADIRNRASSIASFFGIRHLLDRAADKTLSGGERAKVAIGRALVKRPEIVFLDEPTGSVDPSGKVEIFEKLSQIKEEEGLTLVVVTHDLDQVRAFADREVVIESGKIVAETAA